MDFIYSKRKRTCYIRNVRNIVNIVKADVVGVADGTRLGFGRYGTKSCRAGRLSYRAIEAARRATIGQFHRAMSGQFRRNGKIWVRVFADLPITGKPTEVRMGRGKGNPTGWIARVSTGQILFEMDGVSLSNARQAATLAAHKLCLSTKFVQWS